MSVESIYRWHEGALEALEYCDMADTTLETADSWFVTDGVALALGVHRDRFLGSMDRDARTSTSADAFWDAAIASIPRTGDWFPRVELQRRSGGLLLVLRLRGAPARNNNVVVASWTGADPRTRPLTKGPDLAGLLRIRTAIQPSGAAEAILLTPEGYLIEGSASSLLWWRGDILCVPPAGLDRIDGVTVRSVLTLATALGIETFEEAVTPTEIADTELWSLNALHGVRIVTRWLDGPPLAQLPGRLTTWRARLDALRKPV